MLNRQIIWITSRYMTTNDALSRRILLEEIESPMTGTIHVEELVLLSEDDLLASRAEDAKPKQCRRLIFRRNPNLIQSEASLIPVKVPSKERDRGKNGADVGRRQSGNRKKHKARDSVLGLRTGASKNQGSNLGDWLLDRIEYM